MTSILNDEIGYDLLKELNPRNKTRDQSCNQISIFLELFDEQHED